MIKSNKDKSSPKADRLRELKEGKAKAMDIETLKNIAKDKPDVKVKKDRLT